MNEIEQPYWPKIYLNPKIENETIWDYRWLCGYTFYMRVVRAAERARLKENSDGD